VSMLIVWRNIRASIKWAHGWGLFAVSVMLMFAGGRLFHFSLGWQCRDGGAPARAQQCLLS